MALRSVQRLTRRGGFRQRLFNSRARRDFLEYQAIARIQGTEGEDAPHGAHERWERLLRRAVHGPEQGPE